MVRLCFEDAGRLSLNFNNLVERNRSAEINKNAELKRNAEIKRKQND